MNTLFGDKYCYAVYAKNKTEAIKKIKPIIECNTNVLCEGKKFIEFDFDPQLDTHNKREAFVERLLKREESLNNKDYPIGYFITNIREVVKTEIVGAVVEKQKTQSLKFVNAYRVQKLTEIAKGEGAIVYDEKEAIELAKHIAQRDNTKVFIDKTKMLENGTNRVTIASASPKTKSHYNNNKLYYFFGIDEAIKNRYKR